MDTDTAPISPEHSSHQGLVPLVLDVALQAQRSGALEELVRKRPLVARWMMRKHWRVVRGTAGHALEVEPPTQMASLLLRWLVTQLRPDSEANFKGIGDDAWLQLPVWRPMLAVASYTGLLPIPDFSRHYRRHAGEAPLDNLCGLWGVDPSTIYRLLEKARQSMALILTEHVPDAARRLALRSWVTEEMHARLKLETEAERQTWHSLQSSSLRSDYDPASDLWHLAHANDEKRFVAVLLKHAATLAVEPDTEALVAKMAAAVLKPRTQFDLWLARAAIARARNLATAELQAYEQCLRVAQANHDPLLLGIVHSALGKFYESRDADRAFAYYQDSADFLGGLDPQGGDEQALAHFVTTFARLAWLYVLRNDERSKAVLDRAEVLRQTYRVPDDVLGMLEQVWGQYWRRAGDLGRSLEHRYRALNIFERIGDQRSVMAAYVNIAFDLAERGDHDRAIEFSERILVASRRGGVEPEAVVNAHFNLGATYFWKGNLDTAIAEYQQALEQSLQCDLRLHAFRARYNLAEAYYTRFRARGDFEDERNGDSCVRDVLATSGSESIRNVVEAARNLKSELLGQAPASEPNRLLPNESAIHFDELSEIHRQREILAVPADPESHAQAHLVIARAYAAIAAKEREAALALIQRAGLQDRFSSELTELQQTFERGLTREQQLANTWKQQASDLLDDARRASLIAHLQREGAINKSRYAELGLVSPATASKHLAMLTERGLLVQQGKGPSTRYVLPA
jgi:tetratricopeptide (TPR) repeat protein